MRLAAYTLAICVFAAPALAQAPDRLALERDLAAELTRYGEAHPRIRTLRARIDALAEPAPSAALCQRLAEATSALIAEEQALATRYGPRHDRRRQNAARRRALETQRRRFCPRR